MAGHSIRGNGLRRPAVRALCIVFILFLLVAAPVMAKNDKIKPEKTWPGQGVGPEKTDTPVPTVEPTLEPTAEPTTEPTTEPTADPTTEPTTEPTAEPTIVPTTEPTTEPTIAESKPEPAATELAIPGTETPVVTPAGAGRDGSADTGGPIVSEDDVLSEAEDGFGPFALLVPAVGVTAAGVVIFARRRKSGPDDPAGPKTTTGGAIPPSVLTVVHGSGTVPVSAVHTACSGFPEPLAPKYRNIEYLGQGGIGRVYRAERIDDGRVVAVKTPIVPDEQTGTHFMREIRFWERLHHPNILAIHAANILPVPYVEMEYAPRSLADCPLPLSPEAAVCVIRGIAAGLSFAHDAGVIHRDIKPENILCLEDGTPKITDWGLGTVTDGDHRTRVGGFSPGYAAPEQLRPSVYGTEDERTDLYQLGVLFFELLTGTTPFAGAGTGEMTLAILGEPALLPSLSGATTDVYDAVILRCLAKEKEGRFSCVVDFCEALQQAAGDPVPPEHG